MRTLALAEWLLIELAKPDEQALNRRIYASVRNAILGGVLPAGARLPSSRDLARDLNVSRNTVVSAIDQLLAEGYVEARIGSGTYVALDLPDDLRPRRAPAGPTVGPTADKTPPPSIGKTPAGAARQLSARGQRLTERAGSDHFEVQPFAPGPADYAAMPFKHWNRLINNYLTRPRPELLDCGDPGGHVPLREAVARYLTVSRSVKVEATQILITSSTQQSLDLCAHLLAGHGDTAWIENPCYWGARRAFEAAGLRLRPIAVDAEGIAPDTADWQTTPRLIYVTPSNQYPTGAVMSLERRRRLLEFAARTGAWIIEDDYDSEFRYEGRPLAALQGMDVDARVIYLGTFSKVLYQGLRLGYMVVPADLVERFKIGLYDLHRPGQLILQAALADFMSDGHFEAHIRRLRIIYGERRALLREILERELQGRARVSRGNAGMNLVIELPPGSDDRAYAAAAARVGLSVRPLSNYAVKADGDDGASAAPRPGLLVGFAYVTSADIAHYGQLLARVLLEGLAAAAPDTPDAPAPDAPQALIAAPR